MRVFACPKMSYPLKRWWEFSLPNKLYPLKRLREFLIAQKVLSSQMIKRVFHWVQSSHPLKYKLSYLHNSLAKHLWHSIRNWALHCNICLFQERSFLLPLFLIKGLRDWEFLVVKHLNTKEGMSLCVSEGVKDYKIVELPSGFLGDWM